jgi:hypothetical protein
VPLLPLDFGVEVEWTAPGAYTEGVPLDPGTFTEGAWHRLQRADAAERQDRPPSRRPLPGDGGYGRPPDGYVPLKVRARVDCPECGSRQVLDDGALALDFDRKRHHAVPFGSSPWWDDSA